MSIVTIELGNKSFKLSCSDESKKHLLGLAEKLDFELSEMQKSSPSASFELLLVMTALGLMDDKHSKITATAGDVLKTADKELQSTLSSLQSELGAVVQKFDKY